MLVSIPGDLISFKIILIEDALTAFSIIVSFLRKESVGKRLWINYCCTVYPTQKRDSFSHISHLSLKNGDMAFFPHGQKFYFGIRDGNCITCIKVPSLAECSFDYSMYASRFCHHQMSEEYALRQQLAKILTLGGGWACLRKGKYALRYTFMLYECAFRLKNQKLQLKSILFLARNFMWSDDTEKAIVTFSKLLALASKFNDKELQNQCHLGIAESLERQKIIKENINKDKRLIAKGTTRVWDMGLGND